ncbi:rod shape-determining protein MreC [bacterium]|nr:rod shape-determining protein MreC [bacterium]
MPEFLWKWRREIIFSLLIIMSLGMLVSQRNPGMLSGTLRHSIFFVFVPFQKTSSTVAKRVRGFFAQVHSNKKLRKENAELKRKTEKLTLRNTLYAAQVQENAALRHELNYQKRNPYQLLPAELIGRDPVSWLDRIVIDRGSNDAIQSGAGVITPFGVVGRIGEVSTHAATVMLLLDVQSSVAGSVKRSRVNGTVKGTGKPFLKLLYVSSDDDVRVGDVVETSKLSSLFPQGLPIGDVMQVKLSENGMMLDIIIKPRINFKQIDRFLILTGEE